MKEEAIKEEISWKNFLENEAPNTTKIVADALINHYSNIYKFNKSDLQLHCDSEHCGGKRFFDCKSGPTDTFQSGNFIFQYTCKNCRITCKTYAIFLNLSQPEKIHVTKIGELPAFGPHTPSRIIKMIGPDKDIFLKGRQAENLGLGIGAFSYYRRVVENQKNRILDEIISVAKKVNLKESDIKQLNNAKKETQFSKSVEQTKDLIPQTLLISGHNPLTLLHKALSEGLHQESDEKCLEFAKSIRIILTELAEKLSEALKDHNEIKQALNQLINKK